MNEDLRTKNLNFNQALAELKIYPGFNTLIEHLEARASQKLRSLGYKKNLDDFRELQGRFLELEAVITLLKNGIANEEPSDPTN